MIKGAVFDVDGTLLDSMSLWSTIGEDYLRFVGYEPRENLNETFKNMTLRQAAYYYITEYSVTLSVDEIVDGVNAMIGDYYKNRATLKPYAADFLEQLDRKGVKMCIATATDRPFAEAALERCGVLQYFSEIFTCTLAGHGKDEPFIYREAAGHLGSDRGNTVVFEDSLYAIETAKADGFITTAVFDSYEENQKEIKALADFYLTDFRAFHLFWKFASGI